MTVTLSANVYDGGEGLIATWLWMTWFGLQLQHRHSISHGASDLKESIWCRTDHSDQAMLSWADTAVPLHAQHLCPDDHALLTLAVSDGDAWTSNYKRRVHVVQC